MKCAIILTSWDEITDNGVLTRRSALYDYVMVDNAHRADITSVIFKGTAENIVPDPNVGYWEVVCPDDFLTELESDSQNRFVVHSEETI